MAETEPYKYITKKVRKIAKKLETKKPRKKRKRNRSFSCEPEPEDWILIDEEKQKYPEEPNRSLLHRFIEKYRKKTVESYEEPTYEQYKKDVQVGKTEDELDQIERELVSMKTELTKKDTEMKELKVQKDEEIKALKTQLEQAKKNQIVLIPCPLKVQYVSNDTCNPGCPEYTVCSTGLAFYEIQKNTKSSPGLDLH
jgi:hypothetical protein